MNLSIWGKILEFTLRIKLQEKGKELIRLQDQPKELEIAHSSIDRATNSKQNNL